MADVISIDLRGAIPQIGAIQFVRADLPKQARSSLALVRYSRSGEEQVAGRRLDLDKRVFIDHFENDGEVEDAFNQAAPQIASYVGKELRRRAS